MLLISFSCLMKAVFPPEVFFACMCRTALHTKLSTQLFEVFLVMSVSSSNNLSNISVFTQLNSVKQDGEERWNEIHMHGRRCQRAFCLLGLKLGSSLFSTKLHASNTGYATLISTLVTSFCPGFKTFPPFCTGWPAKLSHHGLFSVKGLQLSR